VHAWRVGHDTPDDQLNDAPGGEGVGSIVHLAWLQRSASVVESPCGLVAYWPTAVQRRRVGHETPISWLGPLAGDGLG
jgi:hypothetical protein